MIWLTFIFGVGQHRVQKCQMFLSTFVVIFRSFSSGGCFLFSSCCCYCYVLLHVVVVVVVVVVVAAAL